MPQRGPNVAEDGVGREDGARGGRDAGCIRVVLQARGGGVDLVQVEDEAADENLREASRAQGTRYWGWSIGTHTFWNSAIMEVTYMVWMY